MIVVGIICEFNPFHNGHKYLIEKCKEITESDYVIGIMSGNFTQRGEVAIIDKFFRAKTAVENGMDLVLEYPLPFSISGAEDFAYYAIKILNNLNICDFLCFGSESSIDKLENFYENMMKNKDYFDESLKKHLNSGYSYSNAYFKTFNSLVSDNLKPEFASNNLLALEYIKALREINSKIKPVAVKRTNSYNAERFSTKHLFQSALSIRKDIVNNSKNYEKYIPKTSMENIYEFKNKFKFFPTMENYFEYIKYNLIFNEQKVKDIIGYENGLENFLKKNISTSKNFDEFLTASTVKRYSKFRIKRFLINLMLNMTKDKKQKISKEVLKFIRPLALNKNGAEILARLKNDFYIVNSFSKYKKLSTFKNSIQAEINSSKFYYMPFSVNYEEILYKTSPIYKKD